ncbi:hypothetical protein [Luteibacter sp.]|jgi:hypothetical protein|uniref:hypothetical protein n=1 Tax=Luteibacter sp. TaxID=1886636 RepID=UPI002F3E941F
MTGLVEALRGKRVEPIDVDPDIPVAIDLMPDPGEPDEARKVIPVALSDGEVAVTCPKWGRGVDDDTAQAFVLLPGGDPEQPDPLSISDSVRLGDFVGDLEMRLDLAPLNVANGDDRAFDLYVAQGSVISDPYVSRVYRFRVDKRPPGGDAVPALRFAQDVVDDGVTSDKLSVDSDGNEYLSSAVVPYLYKARGDLIRAFIDGAPVGAPVEVVDILEPEEELPFPRVALEAAGNGAHVFTCQITDRAGNVSAMSLPVILTVRFTDMPGGGDPLARAKWVEGPAGGAPEQIDYDKAVSGGGTPVRIYEYANMASGDRIHVVFQGYDDTRPPPVGQPIPESAYTLDYDVVPTDLDPRQDDTAEPPVDAVFINILIPTRYLLPITYGRAHFDYTVTNDKGTGIAEQAWIYVATRH